jgi:hypothetical protein
LGQEDGSILVVSACGRNLPKGSSGRESALGRTKSFTYLEKLIFLDASKGSEFGSDRVKTHDDSPNSDNHQ